MLTTANRDHETLTPYGVVSLNSLADWVWDEFLCSGISLTAEAIAEEALADHPEWDGELPDDFWDDIEIEEETYRLEDAETGMILELGYLGGAPLVWVIKSPHRASVRECSPCCPNAGDLDSKVEPGMGVVCYDLPPDWYYHEED